MAEHQEHSTKRQIVNFSGKPALMRHLSRDTPTRKLANKHHCQLIQKWFDCPQHENSSPIKRPLRPDGQSGREHLNRWRDDQIPKELRMLGSWVEATSSPSAAARMFSAV